MSERRVHLWPARDAFIDGVPPVELTVEPDVADRLTAYQPPAFTRSRPEWWDEDRPASDEDLARLGRFLEPPEPPAEVAANQPADPPEGGSLDSEDTA